MLAIRLARVGAKKQAAYRVVVMEKSRARDSRSVEILGHYNPRETPTLIELKQDRVDYWLGKGAQPSDRVHRLIKVYKDRPAEPAGEAAAEKKPAGKTQAAAPAAAEAPSTEPAAADAAPAAGEEPKPTA